jgi:DhnA family fructose-bisphosphate aldolase class Ia
VVFGRNVLQAQDSIKFLRALKEVVQGRSSAAETGARYGLR